MGIFGFGKDKKEKVYLCSKYLTLDIVIKPHPTKDRNGVTEGAGHHITFKNGIFKTSDPEDVEFLEKHEYYKSGIIVDAHIQEAKERAVKIEKLEKEAATLGLKLVKS